MGLLLDKIKNNHAEALDKSAQLPKVVKEFEDGKITKDAFITEVKETNDKLLTSTMEFKSEVTRLDTEIRNNLNHLNQMFHVFKMHNEINSEIDTIYNKLIFLKKIEFVGQDRTIIGKGGFGVVVSSKNNIGELKLCYKIVGCQTDILEEIPRPPLMSCVTVPLGIMTRSIIVDRKKFHICFYLYRRESGDLFSIPVSQHMIDRLITECKIMWSAKWVHGDIKPQNILYDIHTERFKLCDSENIMFSKDYDDVKDDVPKTLAFDPGSYNLDFNTGIDRDVFSLGITIAMWKKGGLTKLDLLEARKILSEYGLSEMVSDDPRARYNFTLPKPVRNKTHK